MATVEFESEPFSEGSSRWVYRGVKELPGGERELLVLKRFKKGYYSQYSRYKYTNLDIVVNTARQLAGRFNVDPSIPLSIYFMEPFKQVNIEKLYCGIDWVAVERFLDGSYTKWLSNAGWVNHEAMGGNDMLPAFSHWTWVETKGELLVSDLQGVKYNQTDYCLTDPAIHSMSRKYGQTDLGKIGINQFFMTHKCNKVCQLLRLEGSCPSPRVQKYSQWLSEYRSTIYYNEIVWMYNGEKDDGYYDIDYNYDFAGVKNGPVSSRQLPQHMLKKAPGNPASKAPENPLPSNQLISEQEHLLSRFSRASENPSSRTLGSPSGRAAGMTRCSNAPGELPVGIQESVRLGVTLILVAGGAISGHIIATTLGTSGDIHAVDSALMTLGGGLGAAVGCKFGGFIGNELGGDFGVEFIGSLMGGTLGGLGGVFSAWILWCRI